MPSIRIDLTNSELLELVNNHKLINENGCSRGVYIPDKSEGKPINPPGKR